MYFAKVSNHNGLKKKKLCCWVFFLRHQKEMCQHQLLLFSRSVVSDSLQLHGLQHTQASLFFTVSRSLLKPTSIESVMPSTISSSVVPFSFCLQSFPAPAEGPIIQFWQYLLGNSVRSHRRRADTYRIHPLHPTSTHQSQVQLSPVLPTTG